jgi:hypothetical protein
MTDNQLQRDTDELIRATIDGEPESEWDGLANADIWWVLTDAPNGGTVVESFSDSDSEMTVVTDGGGSDAGEITVDLSPSVTGGLDEHYYWQEVVLRDSAGEVSAAALDPHRLEIVDNSAGEVIP